MGRSRNGFRARPRAAVTALCLALLLPAAAAADPPRGFHDRVVHAGLNGPTTLAVARDGTVFVAERAGTIARFDGPRDRTPTVVADLSEKVNTAGDRGLLGLVLDPDFPRQPYIYVAYTYDGPIGGSFPTWKDSCPYPGIDPSCPVSGRVARLTVGKSGIVNDEWVMAEDWCMAYSSHSIGDLAFDRQGMLLISGGDGASWAKADFGDLGGSPDACSDGSGEGGALRAQGVLTTGDPPGLDGTIARIDPSTGEAAPGNGVAGEGDDQRIAGFGLRNPFRFTIKPGTDELWIGDVGWKQTEEIDRMTIGAPADFGWPCFEGRDPNLEYAAGDTAICNHVYDSPWLPTAPWFTYSHNAPVTQEERCSTRSSSISGIAFDRSSDFPRRYRGALFFADFVRNCIWSFRADANGDPRPDSVRPFEAPSHHPVDLVSTKAGLYYPDLLDGTIHLISADRSPARGHRGR